jgi:hypothetical protein
VHVNTCVRFCVCERAFVCACVFEQLLLKQLGVVRGGSAQCSNSHCHTGLRQRANHCKFLVVHAPPPENTNHMYACTGVPVAP